jgi:modulator of FtsH protease HflK
MSDDHDFEPPIVTSEHIEGLRTWLRSILRFVRGGGPASVDADASTLSSKYGTTDGSPPSRGSVIPRLRPGLLKRSILPAGVLIIGVWASSGFYKVEPDERSIVIRFGQWVDTRRPGLNYHLPFPIESDLLIHMTQLNQAKFWNGAVVQMLTGDENIVEVSASASWRIADLGNYAFAGQNPQDTARVAGEIAIRQVIALNPMQSALFDKRQKIADDAQKLMQRLLDSYQTGIEVVQIQLERVDPPAAVVDAFNDVQRARADQERARNEAEAYSKDILPRARGEAARMLEEAEAYRQSTLNQAESDAQRYGDMRDSYLESPAATIRHLYFDTMEDVLKSAGKILLESPNGQVSTILPFVNLDALGAARKDQP